MQPVANMSYNTRLSQLRQERAWHTARGDSRLHAVLKYMPLVGARHASFHFRHYFIAGRQLAGCVVFVRLRSWLAAPAQRARARFGASQCFFSFDSYLATLLRQAGWGLDGWLCRSQSGSIPRRLVGWWRVGRKTWVGRFRGSMKSCVRSLMHAGCWVATGHDQARL